MLPSLLDLSNPFHRLDRSLHQLAIVADGNVSALLEIDGSVLKIFKAYTHEHRYTMLVVLTMVISLPAALRKALVHRTLRGFRFILIVSAIDIKKKKGTIKTNLKFL